ncbi:MAG TPA: hypothetical protein PLY80_10485, partial [Pseudomonadota bacterium]|nr:hypothetical protein [Pseudomonadota bacterium]
MGRTRAGRYPQRLWAWLLPLLLIGLPALGAKPRKPPPAQLSPAEKLTEQGLQALTEKDFSRAYAALSEAYRLAPTAESLLQLGRLAAAEQRPLEAQDLLRRYLLDPARK